MPSKCWMVQGTGSHVGKSVLVTALCRILRRRGLRVAPFKAMNMSNNAWVTAKGGEIAYAQAVQAWAAGVEPVEEMNPVLLKTTSDSASQVILLGKPLGVVPAYGLARYRQKLLQGIESSLSFLRENFEVVLIEGAGSPAEINLKATDLANMRVAEMADAPVLLVVDIERGGAFAQAVGTLELLEPSECKRIFGFVINKFRGDLSILQPGLDWLEARTGKPVLGVIPYLQSIRIPEEDSLADRLKPPSQNGSSGPPQIRIQVIRYPTISNFTDFKPLEEEPGVRVEYLTEPPVDGRLPHLLVLPGAKSTVADLLWLRERGFERYIQECLEKKVEVAGICGGLQMLGEFIYDPSHVESPRAAVAGLGLLPTTTLFLQPKVTEQVEGLHPASGLPVRGYEIHAGRLQGARRGRPVFRITRRGGRAVDAWDGCQRADGLVWGTYLHGLFDDPALRRYFLSRFGDLPAPFHPAPEDPYDALADQVEAALNWTPSV